MLSWSLVELDEFDAAIAASIQGREAAERRGAVALLPMSIAATAAALTYSGRWDDALAEIDAAVDLCNEIGNPTWIIVAAALRGSICLHRGQREAAEVHLADGMARLLVSGPGLGTDALVEAQIELLVVQRDLAGAFALARMLWDQSAGVRYVVGHRQRAVLAVRLAMANGEVDFAREVTETLEVGAQRTPAASGIATALRCRGLLERRPELLLEAADHLRATPRQLELAVCCEDAGTVLAEADRNEEAISALRQAAAVYREIGAAGDADRVDAALRSLGAPRARRRPPRPAFGWEALTPTELNVAQLTAEGLTNPLIGQRLYISRRTVEAHLSTIYRKLDITNRTMLVAALTARTA